MKTGIELIIEERHRQATEEGYTPGHDDAHRNGEIAAAAAVYAAPMEIYRQANGDETTDPIGLIPDRDNTHWAFRYVWPWGEDECKMGNRIRELTKAGALCAAEIDRLNRLESGKRIERERGERVSDKKRLPSDFEIKGQVHSLWRNSLNQEPANILGCLASRLNVERTKEFDAHVLGRLKALARAKEIRKFYLLPGRIAYTIG